jgi:hypothetical protein
MATTNIFSNKMFKLTDGAPEPVGVPAPDVVGDLSRRCSCRAGRVRIEAGGLGVDGEAVVGRGHVSRLTNLDTSTTRPATDRHKVVALDHRGLVELAVEIAAGRPVGQKPGVTS